MGGSVDVEVLRVAVSTVLAENKYSPDDCADSIVIRNAMVGLSGLGIVSRANYNAKSYKWLGGKNWVADATQEIIVRILRDISELLGTKDRISGASVSDIISNAIGKSDDGPVNHVIQQLKLDGYLVERPGRDVPCCYGFTQKAVDLLRPPRQTAKAAPKVSLPVDSLASSIDAKIKEVSGTIDRINDRIGEHRAAIRELETDKDICEEHLLVLKTLADSEISELTRKYSG